MGEFAELCVRMGHKLKDKQLAKAMTELDADGDGTISFDEFEQWWRGKGGTQPWILLPSCCTPFDR